LKKHSQFKPTLLAFALGLLLLLTGSAITVNGWVYTNDGLEVIEGAHVRIAGISLMIVGAMLAGNYILKKLQS
jgi:hypothetical protein